MGDAATSRTMTAQEFLTWEADQDERHVFWDGEIFAMAGASLQHNRIVANLMRALGNQLVGKPCEAFPSDLRVQLAARRFCYSDVTIVRGRVELLADATDTVLNPRVVIEVISDATERFDRGEKFKSYRSVATITEVVFVSQDERSIEHFVRGEGESWVLRAHTAGEVPLLDGGARFAIDDVYRNVELRP